MYPAYAVMMVLPSDHLMKEQGIFLDTLKEACEIAIKDENLVTVGITPNDPETGYGYIKNLPLFYIITHSFKYHTSETNI